MAWVLPDLNQYGNVHAEARRTDGDLLLVHPVWLAAPWWNIITTFGVRQVDLQTADKSLRCAAKTRPGPGFWKMRVTLLRFEVRVYCFKHVLLPKPLALPPPSHPPTLTLSGDGEYALLLLFLFNID